MQSSFCKQLIHQILGKFVIGDVQNKKFGNWNPLELLEKPTSLVDDLIAFRIVSAILDLFSKEFRLDKFAILLVVSKYLKILLQL